MFHFDLAKEPLTNLELKTELQILKNLRKVQIKYSCVSDVLHAFVFITLYFNHFLSGYAITAAVMLSTGVALLLATATRQILSKPGLLTIATFSLGTTVTTGILLNVVMKQPLTGSIIAALATGSIVIVGATLGRKIKSVLTAIENMKPIVDDDIAWQKVMALCHQFPELDRYRKAAAQYLRPHLAYGELRAMQEWADKAQAK
ncbi:hypothetical protein [uncultured Desulfuromusa sp.]|uniref:hypothetical protein n=1 Tax=uncultured Desulfuromusa sp. TaxID=219183 RepID=UPI002AA68A62|nr:hypothetical protein [uncultured Desulfuromusa sp.]